MANKTLKHFSLFGVNFTQRPSDLYIDCSELCKQRNKPLSNWTRTSNAKEYLSKVENSLIITNSKNHTWIHEKCLKGLLQFLDINYGEKYHELEAELDKDFPNSGPITEKICSCCKLNKSIDNFGVNKNKSDGYDIRCKECYKKDREKTKDYHNTRSTEYYHNNKEHCLKVKKEWQHNNVEKTRVANKRYTIKKQTEKHDNKEKIKSGIINDLESINIDDNNLRRNELLDICKEFNIPVYAKDNKNIIIGKINNYISTHKDDNEDEDEKSEDEEENSDANEEVEIEDNIDLIIENNILTLNNIEIIARKLDGFINATQMCKAGGKQFYHWKENKHSEQFIKILSSSIGIPMDEIIKYENGSNNERSTWCHPRVAINIAQWISAEFDVKVTGWIQELLTTGSVTLNQEKTAKELDEIWKSRLIDIENSSISAIHKFNDHVLEYRNNTKSALVEIIDTLSKLFNETNDNWSGQNVLYFAYIGEIDGKCVFKYGESSNFAGRQKAHNNNFSKFNLIIVRQCYNSLVAETEFKKFIYEKNRKFTSKYDNKVYDELCYAETKEELLEMRQKIIEISNNNCITTIKNSVNELDKLKLEKITELFSNGKLTFEQYEKLLLNLK
uniref:KilA-N domain-containing protein n=1 Tax=viral metagenome TaxID=1070528 RepID=A0A6C0D0H7_9ZZZZ